MPNADRQVRRKLAALEHVGVSGAVSRTCRFFAISRDTFHGWRKAHAAAGEAGLSPRRRGPRGPQRNQFSPAFQGQVLRTRREFNFGPQRIAWYLVRYHDIGVST